MTPLFTRHTKNLLYSKLDCSQEIMLSNVGFLYLYFSTPKYDSTPLKYSTSTLRSNIHSLDYTVPIKFDLLTKSARTRTLNMLGINAITAD